VLSSVVVLDGEAWDAIGCCCDGCAFEVEGADACRSAAMKARALTFTTPPSIVEGDERTVCMSMTANARADTSNECKHHMSYIARLTGSC
jgi:hypothetical protein